MKWLLWRLLNWLCPDKPAPTLADYSVTTLDGSRWYAVGVVGLRLSCCRVGADQTHEVRLVGIDEVVDRRNFVFLLDHFPHPAWQWESGEPFIPQ